MLDESVGHLAANLRCRDREGRTYPGRVHLGLVTIVVDDYDSAIRFFVDALNFELVEDSPR